MKKLLITTLALGAINANAGNLKSPFSYSSTKVLPKGVRNLKYAGLVISANNKFDNLGDDVPVGAPLNKDVTFQDIIDGEDDARKRGQIKGYLQTKGLGFDDFIGSTTGVVNVAVDGHVPILAWGITEKLTMAMAVPVIKTKVHMDTGAIVGGGLDDFADVLIDDGKADKAYEVSEKFMNAISRKLDKYGYEQLEDFEETKLGDIKLVSKYSLANEKYYGAAVQGEVTLPTGMEKNINRVVDVPAGDGQTDLGVTGLFDVHIASALSLNFVANYTNQLPDSTTARIPEKRESTLTKEVKEVHRDLGDTYLTAAGFTFSPVKGLSLQSAFAFQYKQRDEYRGIVSNQDALGWMAQNSEQHVQTAQFGIAYSTIPLFREKKFVAPLAVSMNYTQVLDGKNVTNDSMVNFELNLFF